jgi:hypothetical protein
LRVEDPDKLLREYDVSHQLRLSSYILNNSSRLIVRGSRARGFLQESGQLTVKPGIRRSVLTTDFAADIGALSS